MIISITGSSYINEEAHSHATSSRRGRDRSGTNKAGSEYYCGARTSKLTRKRSNIALRDSAHVCCMYRLEDP